MPKGRSIFPRQAAIKGTTAAGARGLASSASGSPGPLANAGVYETIRDRVDSTTLVDTHEHLIEEDRRLAGEGARLEADDWSFLIGRDLGSLLLARGLSPADRDALFSSEVDPIRKWDLLEPHWPRVRDSGYAQALEIAVERLYGVEGLRRETIQRIQDGYRRAVRPGFYKTVLRDVARIESCQVSSLEVPFSETAQPRLLMQDLSILGMHMGPDVEAYAEPSGIEVRDLSDWHRVIDWWFDAYGPWAVAVKTQAAYSRDIDFEDVPPEEVEGVFGRTLARDPVPPTEEKRLQDHLFWYCARKATEHDLPLKVPTGGYVGADHVPTGRLLGNAEAASRLCRAAPDTRFVFLHINYPYYEDLIAVAKRYTNCYVDMCWAWIVNPVAANRFLMQYLVTAPAHKVLTFGGDYVPVEPVVGHAVLARRGITNALSQLVDEGWLDRDAALDLVDPIMRGNAHALFDLDRKSARLAHPPWLIHAEGSGPKT
jgi:hypothetical protein